MFGEAGRGRGRGREGAAVPKAMMPKFSVAEDLLGERHQENN